MRNIRTLILVAAGATGLLMPLTATAHEFDHPAPSTAINVGPVSTQFNAAGGEWELVTTIVTGNPHTDLDYFRADDNEVYASVGTLAVGPNGGGQTIVKLTDGGLPSQGGTLAPEFVAGHPSAACPSSPLAALGLQHDVEATPKGDVPYNIDWGDLVDREASAQLLLDATDADGRCHDGGTLGLSGAPQGGIEIIDVTTPAEPVEIALTSHIGEAHTVNVDPSRPHIAYVVSSDSVSIRDDGTRTNGPANDGTEGSGLGLDGFEILDLSSCLITPYGTMDAGPDLQQKREDCKPEVYRYRYPSVEMALGHTNRGAIWGCHELEVHPNDILTCGAGAAMIVLDMSSVFDDTDGDGFDEVQGEPLPCRQRSTTSVAPFTTGATITDCVDGADDQDLSVNAWLQAGAPSVEGVEWLGSVHHMGREDTAGAFRPEQPATEDIDFDHEAELTHSGQFVLATDERGGGVLGGAQCSPGVDLEFHNGGIHAYRIDRLTTDGPGPEDKEGEDGEAAARAHEAYARTPDGEKAIARAPINTQPQVTECTAHVFHQVPGQNRIFMGWYTQGTQVWDYVEDVDEETGEPTFEWHHVGYFIPEYANTWVSAVFDVVDNQDKTFTYYGATGDFNVGNGRGAIDIFKVTLKAPEQFADGSRPDDGDESDRPECDKDRPGKRPPHCDDDGRPGRGGPPDDQEAGNEAAAATPPSSGRDQAGTSGEASDDQRSGEAQAAGSDIAPAPTPTQVIDLRPAAARPSPATVSSSSPLTELSLLVGGLFLAIGLNRRRRLRTDHGS